MSDAQPVAPMTPPPMDTPREAPGAPRFYHAPVGRYPVGEVVRELFPPGEDDEEEGLQD